LGAKVKKIKTDLLPYQEKVVTLHHQIKIAGSSESPSLIQKQIPIQKVERERSS